MDALFFLLLEDENLILIPFLNILYQEILHMEV